MSSRPSWHYHSGNARWELRGKSGVLLNTVPDTSLPFGVMRHYIGTTAAINAGIASLSVATLTNSTGVNRGDLLFATAKTSNLAGGHVAVSVPSNNLVLLTVFGSLPAMGWDVFHIRPISG